MKNVMSKKKFECLFIHLWYIILPQSKQYTLYQNKRARTNNKTISIHDQINNMEASTKYNLSVFDIQAIHKNILVNFNPNNQLNLSLPKKKKKKIIGNFQFFFSQIFERKTNLSGLPTHFKYYRPRYRKPLYIYFFNGLIPKTIIVPGSSIWLIQNDGIKQLTLRQYQSVMG